MTNQAHIFQVLCNFKGIGNPKGQYWFVGIEEAYDFTKGLDAIAKEYAQQCSEVQPETIEKAAAEMGRKYTKIYDIMSKIVAEPQADWKTYRNGRLFQKGSNEFQMNLYPLGKKTTEWNSEYEKIFGFRDADDYISTVREQRFPLLRKFRDDHKPKVTICFGSTYTDDFINAFGLENENHIQIADGAILYYPRNGVFITPFFRYQWMTGKRIDTLREAIRQM